MELWNEYEGSTIAGSYQLERLLRPEGRSAFFATTLGDGRATVLRLIESHYDDDAIVARWNAVTRLKQENLLSLVKFGHVVMDDTSLVYVVMEPSDADLGQILRERALTTLETRQLAVSLVAALEALHAIGMVHEHIQPINVLAVGETVKLRSDCIREAPEGAEGEAARTRDVYNLALLLLQALTLERNPDRILKPAANSSAVPAPFREILYNGLSGRWSLTQIARALSDSAPAVTPIPTPPAAAPTSAPATSATTPAPAAIPTPKPGPVAAPLSAARGASTPSYPARGTSPLAQDASPARATSSTATPAAVAAPSTHAASTSPDHAFPRSNNGVASAPIERGVQAAAESVPAYRSSVNRIHVEPGRTSAPDTGEETTRQRPMMKLALALAMLAIILLLWHFTHRHSGATATAATQQMQTLASMGQQPGQAPATQPPMQRPAVRPAPAQPRNATDNWRVIAFTYNAPTQAKAKADQLTQQNPNLQFEVFSPHGHAPYLVAINGFMSREDAMALRNRLRGHGFPRDLYAQNYKKAGIRS